MSVRNSLVAVLVIGAVWPSAVLACIYPPPPVQLPNEADAAYELRREATFKAQAEEASRRFQADLFDQADRIELAIVRQSDAVPIVGSGGYSGLKVVVEPITPLKGSGPFKAITLADTSVTTCGIGGSGTATSASPGDYVIVFHNISFRDEPRPFGIKIIEAREPRIVDALQNAALRLREGAKKARPIP